MTEELTQPVIRRETAETIYISSRDTSYGIFCFNSAGDLFINSDWGFYGYAWRSFGDDFKKFLAQTNSDYLMGKLELNYRSTTNKKIHLTAYKALKQLCELFINELKQEVPA